MKHTKQKGFTLLEILIVMLIVVILAVVVVVRMKPGEILKKARDEQRIGDLKALVNLLDTYSAQVKTIDFDENDGDLCFEMFPAGDTNLGARIMYSTVVGSNPQCTANVVEGADVTINGTFSTSSFCVYPSSVTEAASMYGLGWIPVKLDENSFGEIFPGGPPIQKLPFDPINRISDITAPTSGDLTFRFACQHEASINQPSFVYELDAVLESGEYATKMATDGGDNANYYEVGSSLKLIGSGTNF